MMLELKKRPIKNPSALNTLGFLRIYRIILPILLSLTELQSLRFLIESSINAIMALRQILHLLSQLEAALSAHG